MNLRLFYNYHTHIRHLFRTDLHLFEISVWIQSFAQSLISVFIPIILWSYGFSIQWILAFYLMFNLIDVPFNLVAQRAIEKFGARIVIMVSILAELAKFLILFEMHTSLGWLIALALAAAIFDTFYWVGHLYIFVESAHDTSQMRMEASALHIIRVVGGLFAPAIGAFLILAIGQRSLIFVSTVIMATSLIPLWRMKRLKFVPEKKSMDFSEFFSKRNEKINFLFEAFAAVSQEFEEVIWPFFIFLIFASVQDVAYIPMLISLAGLVLIYVTGKMSVKKNIYRLISYGALAMAVVWLIRMTTLGNKIIALGSVFIIALLSIFVYVPLEIAVFDRAKDTDSLTATTYLNLFRMGARAILYAFIILSFNPFSLGFKICAISLFIFFVLAWYVSMNRHKLLRPELDQVPAAEDIEKDYEV